MKLEIKRLNVSKKSETIRLVFNGKTYMNLIEKQGGEAKGNEWMKWVRRDSERRLIKEFMKESRKYLKDCLDKKYPEIKKPKQRRTKCLKK